MPSREVLVTYTLYPSGNSDLRTAVSGVTGQFPLRNLHWKSSSRAALRTIQEADVRLIELGDVSPPKDHVAGSVLESPLVNICFVSCDDADIYKNNTKSFIKDWLSLLASRRSAHTSLIVLVNPSTASGSTHSSKNVFGRDRGIIAKLKADFNTSKRDICAQLNLPPAGTSDPAAWPDVINKLKESIVLAFDSSILEREEEVKRGEAQRVTVGWNFCTWFLLKESLAHSFEGVNLDEDALVIYEELEASFLQALKEQNLSWFGKLGGTGPQDDSLPILDTGAKPYRDLLISSTISVFDFRIYVFARQCILLGKIGRITEIAKRGQWFVASLARRLREEEHNLPEYFIESWTYTACLDLVEHCDEWSRIDRPNNDYSGLIAYESARAELLDIARIQVERIGIGAGHLPNIYPFQPTLPILPATDDVLFDTDVAEGSETGSDDKENAALPRLPLSNETFVEALQHQAAFAELYHDLTTKALAAYEACGKVNSAIRLKADLAAMAMHSKDYATAYDCYRLLARDCAELHVWDEVAQYAVEGALAAHAELQKPRDDDWKHLALACLRARAITKSKEDDLEQLQFAIEGLRGLPDTDRVLDNVVFNLRILDETAALSSDVSRTDMRVEVKNALPIAVTVDGLWLQLGSNSFGAVNFSSGPLTLQPGRQVAMLTCTTSVARSFQAREAGVVLGGVSFVTIYPTDEISVSVSRNPHGPRTVLRMPSIIALDEEPHVVLEVQSGTQAINDVRVSINSILDEEVSYLVQRANSEDCGLDLSKPNIGIGNLSDNAGVTVSIPYSGIPRNEMARAQVVLQYHTIDGIACSYVQEHTVFMGLAITVNVQDFFRPEALLLSFAIASDGREHVRVGAVDLQSVSHGYTIDPCSVKGAESILVSPSQPLSCLFKVRPNGAPTGEVLRLSIQYETVEEEVRLSSESALETLSSSGSLARLVREHVSQQAIWLQRYLFAGDMAEVFDDSWRACLPSAISPNAVDEFVAAVVAVKSTPSWRTLVIPVDIPLRRLLTTVRLSPTSGSPVHEGRALTFDLQLSASLAWLGIQPPVDIHTHLPRVSYDVQASADDWVIVGKKRGVYTANPDQPESQQLILVPARAGTIALPPVAVQLVDNVAPANRLHCETYVANAAEGVRVLPARTGMAALVPIVSEWDE